MKSVANTSFIEDTEFYRGQIVFRWDRPNIIGSKSFINTESSFNPYYTLQDYYEHQEKLIEKLHTNKNVLLLAPFNTGKTTIALLYALDVLFNKQRSVLFISANSFEKELEKELLNKILIESKYDWLVDIHDINSEESKQEYNGLFPSIYIIEARDLHWFLLPNHRKYSDLFESLGLIIFDDFEKFSGHLATNIHYINKRLDILYAFYNNDDNLFQTLVLSKPFYQSKSIVERIFNKEFEILNRDDKEITSAKIYYWVPAIDKVDIEYKLTNDTLVRTTKRDSFIDDSYILAIESLKRNKTTVIYYSNIAFSKNDLILRERYLNYIKRSDQSNEFTLANLYIGYDWSDLTSQIIKKGLDWGKIDTIIIAIFSGSLSDLNNDILHIGSTNSEIFITMPQTPSFQFFINHPEIEIRKNAKETAKTENISIFTFSKNESTSKKHFLRAAFELTSIPDANYRNKIFESWKDEIKLENIRTECDSYINRIDEIKGFDIFSTEFEEFNILVNSEDRIIGTVNTSEIPDSYFMNAVVCKQNDRYEVSEIHLDTKKIKLLSLTNFRLPISKRIIKKEKEDEKTTRDHKFSQVNFSVKKIKTSIEFNNYKVSIGTDPHPDSFTLCSEKNLNLKNLEINGVEITGFVEAEAFANIFDISLNTKISLYNLNPNYFLQDGYSFFYNLGSDDLRYIINDEIIRDILERALTILIDCPCVDGCTGCLKNFNTESEELSKVHLIEFLGHLLNKGNLENITRWKFERIGEINSFREDMIKYGEIRDKVFKILEYKANMVIKNPYQIKFINSDDDKWIKSAGLCHGKNQTVYIKPGFREDTFTEILAHEFTHNWQMEGNLHPLFQYFNDTDIEDENNIWFGGKIFAEGQANFFAAKVMDYFGLSHMVFINEIESYAQYREGLILINYLEKKFGLKKLNDIFREAKYNDGTPITLVDIQNWYNESDVKNLIRGTADELIKDKMRCLQVEFLDKSRDFHRLTYFMNHQIGRRDKTLNEYIHESGLTESEAFNKIWKVIKDHFNITPNIGYDFLPCMDCAYKDEESLDGLCMMFGSITVKDKIKNVLSLK